jgi:MFS family permease
VQHIDEALGGTARRRVVLLLGSVLGLQAADTGAVGALAAPLERAFHVGNTEIGLLVTVTTAVGCAATLPFGSWADRHNRTVLLQVVVSLWAAATVVSALSTSYPMLLVSRLALGGVIAAAGPALASLFGDLVPGDERSRLWGYVLIGELVGAGLGILVAGALSGAFGWRIAMGVLALPAVVLAVALNRWLPEPARGGQAYLHIGDDEIVTADDVPEPPAGAPTAGPAEEEPAANDESSLIELGAEAAGIEPEPDLVLTDETDIGFWSAALFVLRIRANLALTVASGLGYFFLAGLETFAELYFRERYGVGQTLATVMFLLVAAGAVGGVVFSGHLTDRLIRNKIINARMIVATFAYLGTTAFFIPGMLTPVMAVSLPLLVIAAFCVGAANPPADAARLDIVPARLWGRAESVRTAMRQSFQGAAPVIYGLVSQAFGGGGAGLSTGVNTGASVTSAQAAHGLELASALLSLPLLFGAAGLWLCRNVYLRETAAARRTDANLAELRTKKSAKRRAATR